MTKRVMVRQGDVLLIELATEPDGLAPVKAGSATKEGLQLAEGESSGHTHRVFGRGCKLFAFRDAANTARVLVVGRSGAELRVVGGGSGGVDRHTPIRLTPGKFEVRIQRTWTGEDEARSQAVAD